ncbi:MAG: DUF4340 domain-containing protein [Planctomycetota bacterium]|nr:DUF4340 domain-containing protein [Planctomycetota bacterium]
MRYTTTLILAVIVLALAVCIYMFRGQLTGPAKPPEKPAETLSLLKDVKMDDLVSATLEEPAGDGKFKAKIAFKKADGAWRLTEPVDWAADDYAVGQLLRAAVEGRYRQSLEPGKKGQPDLKSLGLEPPACRLVLETSAKGNEEARKITVAVGRRVALGEGLYVRVDDAPKVNVLERAELLDRAREKVNAFRSRELLAVGRDDVVRIDLAGEKGAVRLDRSDKDKGRWVMSQPMAARVDPDAASALVRAALGPNAKEFTADDPKDLVRFGLDKPRLTLTLWKQPPPEKPAADKKPEEKPAKAEPVKTASLRFGAWADLKNETVYLLTDDGKHVVTVEAPTFKDLDKSATDLRDKHVLAMDAATATKVTVKLPAKLAGAAAEVSYELARSDGKWKLLASGRPEAKADAATVEGLLKELADLKVLYFAEGERADVAKGFAPQGSVRVQVEGEAAEQGFDIGGTAGTTSLVKNVREDWIGRINEKGLAYLAKGSLDYLDKQVLALDPRKVTAVAIQTADRKVVLEKKDDKWRMTAPIEAEPAAAFVPDLLGQLQDLRCEKYLAAAKEVAPYHLDKPELVCTVTLAPEKPGEKPAEKVLRLAHDEKSKAVGQVEGSDLVFEVSAAVFTALAGEPLEKTLTEVPAADVKDIDLSTEKAKVRLVLIDGKWFRADAKGTPGEETPADPAKELAQTASNLVAARWAAYDTKDAAKFGLDKPALTLKIVTDKTSATVLISGKDVPAEIAALVDQKPARYAMTEGGKRIAILAGKPLETILGAPAVFEVKKEEPKKQEAKPDEKGK